MHINDISFKFTNMILGSNIHKYYDDLHVLKGVNLKVNKGEIVSIVGASGAGKTTLLNLIPRFFTPTKGEIRVDGVSVEDWDLYNLRSFISIVPQETHLFGTSIYENIRYGKLDATKAEIEQAAIDANAHEFITQMSDGYHSLIGERGVKLSGGQRQRIAIARALLRNPSILLLDEATSSLDSVSERQVQQALDRLMENRTTLVIAHRLSTIQHADCILVLENGVLVESGTHEALLNKEGVYAHLHDMQFSEK